MKLLTAELTGTSLDWALAKALGRKPHVKKDHIVATSKSKRIVFKHNNPAFCMAMIKGHVYSMDFAGELWRVFPLVGFAQHGQTLEQAVARCVVQTRLGDEVEVPDELHQIKCWSCGHMMTAFARSENDGDCVKCGSEIELVGMQS